MPTHRNRLAAAVLVVVAAAAGAASRGVVAQPPTSSTAPADLIVINGALYAADRGEVRQALAIRGNRIAIVGSTAEIERLRGPRTVVVDAHGGAVVPGFNDIHTHMLSGGLDMETVNLQGAQTLDDVQSRIRAYAGAHRDLAWIRGRGWGYAPFPNSVPTREQLDAAVPDRPAIMRCFDGHSLWVNTKALAAARITRATPDPPNGVIVRDPATGEPTGLLKESPAMALMNAVVPKPSREEQRRALKQAFDEALRFGVTSVTEAAGTPDDLEVFEVARRAGDLPVRVYYSLLITPGFAERDADRFDALWRAHPDTPRLKTGLVKMFMDGVIETNTALMLAPYANDPSTRGAANYTRDEFERIVTMMDRRGWQIMVHGLGDGAVRMVLDGFERVAASNPMPARGRRHRIEHIETIDRTDVPRFGALGVIASMHPGGGFTPANPPSAAGTPAFLLGAWGRNIGPERAARGGLWKSIAAAGGRVVFGSDWPVASLDAMSRITSIVHRPPRPGGSDQRLPLEEAIDDYTSASAFASFDEHEKGTLAPGMLADVVVLATDIFTHPPAARGDIAVTATIVDGRVVYRP
ncbi:MAG TPA: amidohydrolase [Vicinamibacterales bacterium]|nr:amidohydrolase [Vicinamibacterales bacterium]